MHDASRRTVQIIDPRDVNRLVAVTVDVTSYGLEPHGHGRDFDPGCDPEFTVAEIRNASGSPARLSARHAAAAARAVGVILAIDAGTRAGRRY